MKAQNISARSQSKLFLKVLGFIFSHKCTSLESVYTYLSFQTLLVAHFLSNKTRIVYHISCLFTLRDIYA